MNLWIRILSSFLFLAALPSYSCELVRRDIISLSGPVSTYLNELKIIDQVEMISIYHPVKEYTGKRLAGGLYLSTAVLKSFEGKILFFDKSRELQKVLDRFPKIQTIQIDSRRKTPQEVIELTKLAVTPFLKGCELRVKDFDAKVSELEKEIIKKISKIKESVFFLGKFTSKTPETVMSNDGFVYWLKKENLIKSYPSELEYVNGAMKILSPLKSKYYFFGVEDSSRDGLKKLEKVSDKIFNVTYPGALTPGYTQLEFMKFLVNYF